MTIVALVLFLCVAAIWLTSAAAHRRFQSRVSADVATLLSAATTYIGLDQLTARRGGLPEPVLRFSRLPSLTKRRPFAQSPHALAGFFARSQISVGKISKERNTSP
jgi:hypothetical protein